MTSIIMNPIGYVRNGVSSQTDQDWGIVTSSVELLPDFRDGLVGIDQFSHLLVLTYLHQASFDPSTQLIRRARGLASMPLVGIFAQRAKDRPNPVGVTAVQLVSVTDESVVVRGLDAIDGTPVLDIKPYYPVYDKADQAVVPEWVTRLMQGYF